MFTSRHPLTAVARELGDARVERRLQVHGHDAVPCVRHAVGTTASRRTDSGSDSSGMSRARPPASEKSAGIVSFSNLTGVKNGRAVIALDDGVEHAGRAGTENEVDDAHAANGERGSEAAKGNDGGQAGTAQRLVRGRRPSTSKSTSACTAYTLSSRPCSTLSHGALSAPPPFAFVVALDLPLAFPLPLCLGGRPPGALPHLL